MVQPVITADEVTFRYSIQAVPTLGGLNFSIFPGERVLVAGASGSGKTTLMRLFNGLIPQAYPGELLGTVTVGGRDIREQGIFQLSRITGTVLQDTDAQFVGLTAGEDIAFELENDCVPVDAMRRRVLLWARRFSITDRLEIHPHLLSGGEKQRVAMAGVLVGDSSVLLLDEPLAALDPAAGHAALETLHGLCAADPELTVVIIEHRIDEVLDTGLITRTLVLDDGRIVFDGSPRQLLQADVLRRHGLQEPLSVQVLRRAGVSLQTPGIFGLLDSGPNTASGAGDAPVRDPMLDVSKRVGSLASDILSDLPPHRPTVSGQSMQKSLDVAHVDFAYEQVGPLFQDLSVSFEPGSITGIVGHNGSGKSTLAQIITGFLTPSAGGVRLGELNLLDMSIKQRAEYVGYVLQDPNQMITQGVVYDEVASGLVLHGVAFKDIQQRVEHTLRLVGLYPMRHWPIGALSYGQKKRLSIATVLVLEPRVLILDEPTAGQDESTVTALARLFKDRAAAGTAVIVITHDMSFLLEYVDRAIVLVDGRILADLPPDELLADEGLVARSSLRTTSAYRLGVRLGIGHPAMLNRVLTASNAADNGSRVPPLTRPADTSSAGGRMESV